MNTSGPFPNPNSALKLPRRGSATATGSTPPIETEAQRQNATDLDALQERESNLRAYEARLRAWQEQLDTAASPPPSGGTGTPFPFLRPSSQTPFSNDPALAAAWEKFHRARAILESEQNQLRDDRMMQREAQATLQRREAEIAAREARLAERELLLTIAVGTETEEKKTKSVIQRLTQTPWAVFKSDK